MIFYLGAHNAAWLDPAHPGWATTDEGPTPLFYTLATVRARRKWSRQLPWALDCGAFSAILGGQPPPNVDAVLADWQRVHDNGGRPTWVVSPDWPAHAAALDLGNYTADRAIANTVDNYLAAISAAPFHVAPVLTGNTVADFHKCADRYHSAGVELGGQLVAIGAVYDATPAKLATVTALANDLGARVHLLGVKGSRLRAVIGRDPEVVASPAACSHSGDCRHCLRFARRWAAAQVNHRTTFQPALEF